MPIARIQDLRDGRTHKFKFREDGRDREGFVFSRDGVLRAYVNECRHWTVGLDFDDNRFFTPEGRFIACANHGALYDPETGKCLSGPCAGASLEPLPVLLRGRAVVLVRNRSVFPKSQ